MVANHKEKKSATVHTEGIGWGERTGGENGRKLLPVCRFLAEKTQVNFEDSP